MRHRLAAERLHNQFISRPLRGTPEDLVERFGAVQAQEYPFARWGLALRLTSSTDAAVAEAFDGGRILRTHVLRPTWHFVTPRDIRWMQALTGPRVQRVVLSWTRREGIDRRTLTRAAGIFARALEGGGALTRAELNQHLVRARIVVTRPQLAFLVMHAELEAIVCSGPRRGKQFTYALLAERAPGARTLPPDEALAELTRRYFATHGPATIRDFVWWSGLTVRDTRRGLDMNRASATRVEGLEYWRIGPSGTRNASGVHLLPIYDEYLVAYRDRAAVPHAAAPVGGPTVTFRHAVVADGQVAGTWNTRVERDHVAVVVTPARALSRAERDGVAEAGRRYALFVDRPVALTVRA